MSDDTISIRRGKVSVSDQDAFERASQAFGTRACATEDAYDMSIDTRKSEDPRDMSADVHNIEALRFLLLLFTLRYSDDAPLPLSTRLVSSEA